MKFLEVPAPVRSATLLMMLYVVFVLFNTLSFAFSTDFSNTRELLRGMLRVAGFTLFAGWLLMLDKRAWWFAIIGCSLLSLTGILAAVSLLYVGFAHEKDYLWIGIQLLLPAFLLGRAAFILAHRNTRQYFKTSEA